MRSPSPRDVGCFSPDRVNENRVVTDRFSNPESERRYRDHWPGEPELAAQCEEGGQCGGCAYFAPFNSDWGLCCNPSSRHATETVFEHFSCSALIDEGWGAHSFTDRHLSGRPEPDDLGAAS